MIPYYPHPSEPITDEDIERERQLARELDQRNFHKDQYSNPHRKAIIRLTHLKELQQYDVELDEYSSEGTVLVNRRFILSLQSLKWRVKGKNKWYPCRDVKTFVERYVLANKNSQEGT